MVEKLNADDFFRAPLYRESTVITIQSFILSNFKSIKHLFPFDDFQVLDTKVIFSAEKTKKGNFKGPITYDNLLINLGNGLDIGCGSFVVPTNGLYRFSFSANSAYGKYNFTEVSVH